MANIAFLFDRTNDWIFHYFPADLESLDGFEVIKTFDESNIRGSDVVFVLGYTKILKGDILKFNKSIYVVHESDLPNGRGFSPVQWQILDGKNQIKVSLLEVADVVDSGDIVSQTSITFDGFELYDEIREKQAVATFEVIRAFLLDYPHLKAVPQKGKGNFFRKRLPEDSELNIDRSIRDQFQLLRICNNDGWPAYFVMGGQKYLLKIYKDSD